MDYRWKRSLSVEALDARINRWSYRDLTAFAGPQVIEGAVFFGRRVLVDRQKN